MRIKILAFFSLFISVLFVDNPVDFKTDKKTPNDWFFQQRAYPYNRINHAQYVEAIKQVNNIKKENIGKEVKEWSFAGPTNIGGRLTDVEMHATSQDVIYYGAASGGVFKSVNGGSSFEPVFDEALSLSIGDIALAPSDPNIVYVGTGEPNCGGGSLAYEGVGIYRSDDAGNNWTHIGLEESRNIGRMVVHPTNPDILYVAAMGSLFADDANRGVYKTNDGGQTWEKVLFVNDSTGAIDIVIHPMDPDIVIAAMWERVRRPHRRSYGGPGCGIYKTTNGGATWTELSNGLPSPSPNVGRIGIDICDAFPNVLYAIYADDIGYFDGIYKTQDMGDTWTQTNDGSLSSCYSSYGWWFGRIEVDPTNPDIAYPITFDLYKTSNGGNSWNYISNSLHVDQHAVYIHPENNNKVIVANDGGLYISQNGGSSWNMVDDLPITQFYTCAIDNQNPERLYGGTQDNGTNRTMTGNLNDWQNIYWGDGFHVLVDYQDNDYVYAEYQWGQFARSTNGGSTFTGAMNGIGGGDRMNWNTPVVFDPNNPSILYYGSNKLYKSTNRAVSWTAISNDLSNGGGNGNLVFGTITTISASKLNEELIYVGTDDGNVWRTTNGGVNWDNISISLPDRWITRVSADPADENLIYVTLSGFRWNDFLPHVFKSSNQGDTWEDISNGLPDIPVNDIIIDPEDNQILYLATDAGVFTSRDGGIGWQVMGEGLPTVIVNDLVLHNDSRKLVAGTFGRSMYSYDLYQDTIISNYQNNFVAKQELLLYPNPVTSYVNIELKNCDDQEVNSILIIDIKGRIIKKISGIPSTIDLSEIDFPSGIYYVRIILEEGILQEKMLVL